MWFGALIFLQTVALVASVDMCSNTTETGQSIFLSRTNNATYLYSNCSCSVKSTTGKNETKVTFNKTGEIIGCQYKLAVSYKTTQSYFDCNSSNPDIFLTIRGSEKIKLYLVPTSSNQGGLEFGLDITPNNQLNITLSCYTTPRKPTSPNSSSTIDVTTTITSLEASIAISNNDTTQNVSVSTTSTITTGSESTPSEPSTSMSSANTTVTNDSQKSGPAVTDFSKPNTSVTGSPETDPSVTGPKSEQLDVRIIGGAIGGGILIIALIILVACIVKHKRNGRFGSSYSKPSTTRQSSHGYTDVVTYSGDKGDNSSPEQVYTIENDAKEVEIVPNDLYESSENVLSNPINKQNGNHQREVEIIPNGLYESSDNVLSNPIQKQNGHTQREVEIIPNELYESSDNVLSNPIKKQNVGPQREVEIIPNELYESSENVLSSLVHKQNGHTQRKVENIPNDLYESSDNVISNPIKKQNSDPQREVEIIPNDLYVSSDQMNPSAKGSEAGNNERSHMRSGSGDKKINPDSGNVEYVELAFPHSKVQNGISSNLSDQNGSKKYKIGPEGDDYTIVNK